MRKHVLILRLNVQIVIARCSNALRQWFASTAMGCNGCGSVPQAEEKKKGLPAEAGNPLIFLLNSGADCRFRTGHLMITNQLLYQMS